VLRILNIDKPRGWTSFDVIRWARRQFQEKKAGHLGTLDPLATGVLPVFLGKATKLISLFNEQDKVYRATVRFGIRTDTFDAEGQILAERDPSSVNETMVNEWLQRHLGWQDQQTPVHSAVKLQGTPAYRLARRGEAPELPTRRVFLEQLKLECFVLPEAEITVHCSKGTYIRSLAEQLGQDLRVGAHLSALRRLRCGSRFVIEEAKTPEQLAQEVNPWMDSSRVLSDFPVLYLPLEDRERIRQGQTVPLSLTSESAVPKDHTTEAWYQAGDEQELWALGSLHLGERGPCFQPSKVLI
jgi:tRNA pseudouridine55 synthase